MILTAHHSPVVYDIAFITVANVISFPSRRIVDCPLLMRTALICVCEREHKHATVRAF